MKMNLKRFFKTRKSANDGFTLVELIVTVALMAIVASIVVSSYTNVLEEQRQKADLATLGELDSSVKQILLYDDAFNQVKGHVYEGDDGFKNRFKITFYLSLNRTDSYIDLSNAVINLDTPEEGSLKGDCKILYDYLVEHIGSDIIDLQSSEFKHGKYELYVTFNGAQVSQIRDYTLTNDSLTASNSGDEFMTQDPNEFGMH